MVEKFEERTQARIAEAYGMTETSSVTHVNPMYGLRKYGSVGVPIVGTDARIVDPDTGTQDLPAGQVGELVVKGPQVIEGLLEPAGRDRRGAARRVALHW